MYNFKYHPDGWVCRNQGSIVVPFDVFKAANPDFPIVEGQFFELVNDKFYKIVNIKGTYNSILVENTEDEKPLDEFLPLIEAINNLPE